MNLVCLEQIIVLNNYLVYNYLDNYIYLLFVCSFIILNIVLTLPFQGHKKYILLILVESTEISLHLPFHNRFGMQGN